MPWYELSREENGKTLVMEPPIEAANPTEAIAKMVELSRLYGGNEHTDDGKWMTKIVQPE